MRKKKKESSLIHDAVTQLCMIAIDLSEKIPDFPIDQRADLYYMVDKVITLFLDEDCYEEKENLTDDDFKELVELVQGYRFGDHAASLEQKLEKARKMDASGLIDGDEYDRLVDDIELSYRDRFCD